MFINVTFGLIEILVVSRRTRRDMKDVEDYIGNNPINLNVMGIR